MRPLRSKACPHRACPASRVLLLFRIAEEGRPPLEVKVPSTATQKAMSELESGKGQRFASVEDLRADLHADD